jgi:molybdopterin-binding protein
MPMSARNQLAGVAESVTLGGVMTEVVVAVGDHRIVSVITRRSVEELGLSVGDQVTAVITSTEAILLR